MRHLDPVASRQRTTVHGATACSPRPRCERFGRRQHSDTGSRWAAG